jgi:hypothetical protein
MQGLVIRAATALIEGAAKRTDRVFVLRLECYEVVRGEVIDLLSPTWHRLQVRARLLLAVVPPRREALALQPATASL